MGKSLHSYGLKKLIVLLLILAAALLPGFSPATAAKSQFLNDRAAAIIGARPLAAPGLLAPGGLTGKGEIVGLADSGLDKGKLSDLHPDLQSTPGQMPKVVMLKSWTDRELADDPLGHGTHLAGIIVGSGAASNGQYRGIAPGASLYFQGLLDAAGELAPPDDLARLFRPAYEAGVRVHVNAWGGGANAYRSVSSQIDNFVREHPDFLPIFGAGNSGPAENTLTAEANSKNALVVGASEIPRPAFSPSAYDARRQAEFTSRGPTGDRRLKPDLLAPGSALVSTRSSLVKSNYPANEQYNIMSGTSQAAAVTGGAAAVLRQYLKSEGFTTPSAALLKAALVNGAWTPPGGPDESFPGILDLAGTVLALAEGTMQLDDAIQGLAAGEESTYQLEVKDSSVPLKATLAWTDPPPIAGARAALVNDLDLEITGPNGEQYYGNDFSGQGKPDRSNNLEKIYIANPAPGIYTVKVRANTVKKNSLSWSKEPLQDFALAYGQPLAYGVVSSAPGAGQVTLADGRVFKAPAGGIKNIIDGKVAGSSAAAILPGSDAYLGPHTLYLVGSRWQADGVQALPSGEQDLILEINSRARSGGFFLNPAGSVELNGQAAEPSELPPGFSLNATLNPASETLWRVLAGYKEQNGFLTRVDLEKGQIWLLGQEEPLTLSPQVAVTFADKLVDAAPADRPYGAAERAAVEALVPGMAVRLALQPQSGQVTYIAVKRELALGEVVRVENGSLTLASGQTYAFFPGAPCQRNGEEVEPGAVQVGDWVVLTLMPGSKQIITLAAYSNLNYGRVIYVSSNLQKLYLLDYTNQFRIYELDEESQLYRWGLPVNLAALSPGDWVRLTAAPEPQQSYAWRIDAAPQAGEEVKTLAYLDREASAIVCSDGSRYSLNEKTLVTLDGYRVNAADLPPEALIHITFVDSAGEPVLTRVLANSLPGSRPPQLAVSLLPGADGLMLKGTTSASRLYFYYEGKGLQVIPLRAGNFEWRLPDGEKSFQLVAVNRADGGVTARTINPAEMKAAGFWDSRDHWAAADIKAMVERGVISGYEDGSFRPDNPVTRVELVAFLVRLAGWQLPAGGQPDFADLDAIPDWARAAVAAAQQHGLVDGYPDGTFRPDRPVSRVEAAAFLIRFLAETAPAPSAWLPYRDLEAIPAWGRESVARAYAAELMRGVTATTFAPFSPFTRAQTAAVLNRLDDI